GRNRSPKPFRAWMSRRAVPSFRGKPPASGGARSIAGPRYPTAGLNINPVSMALRRFRNQSVEFLADMRGFRRRAGKRDGAAEGLPRLLHFAGLGKQRTTNAVEVEIAAERLAERPEHGQRLGRTANLGNGDDPVEG